MVRAVEISKNVTIILRGWCTWGAFVVAWLREAWYPLLLTIVGTP